MISEYPLVSICIPSFKPDFFKEALLSAINQTYINTEIIISDNCPDESIHDIYKKYKHDLPINSKYVKSTRFKNDNVQNCFDLASGEYIKFLFDDDILLPECIEYMMNIFLNDNNNVKLVTSKRDKIDENGKVLEDDLSTYYLFHEDIVIDGIDAGNYLLTNVCNVIGEPTTVLFKKSDLIHNKPFFNSFGSVNCLFFVDVNTWLYLLSSGNLFYIVETLSQFRIHKNQNTYNTKLHLNGMLEWYILIKESTKFGYLCTEELYNIAIKNFVSKCDDFIIDINYPKESKIKLFQFIKQLKKNGEI